MKAVVTLLIILIPFVGFGQNVNIPDANFKACLVGNSAINTNGDSQIQVSEAASFNGEINCYNMNISDLTGVESFTDLTNLTCSNNQLTSIDLSYNTALTFLNCANNQLTSIDVSGATALSFLRVSENQLTILDVSTNTALTFLYCLYNQLINLDLRNGNNTEMTVSLTDNPDLLCINVDDSQWSSENWFEIDTQHFFSEDCNMTSLEDIKLNNKFKISEFDLFGRKTNIKNQPFIEIYNDGSVEKKVIIE
jgi:Leucine-rich repeat (LRR) protein